jgi:hypothetical protein
MLLEKSRRKENRKYEPEIDNYSLGNNDRIFLEELWMTGLNLSALAIDKKIKQFISYVGFEPIVWTAAFVFLAIHNPYTQSEFSFCPLKDLGFHYCPGCGLGRSISFLLHGNLTESLHTHILGIPATIVLLFRTLTLLSKTIKRNRVLQLTQNQRSSYGQHFTINADA